MLEYIYREIAALRKQIISHHDNADDEQRMWRETLPRVKVTYNSDADGETIFRNDNIILLTFFISSWNTTKLAHHVDS